jgi:hypothetical protein
MSERIDPKALKEAAEKATPGRREVEWDECDGHVISMGSRLENVGNFLSHHVIEYDHSLYPEDGGQYDEADANARLIAACDPQTILALVAVVDAARAHVNDPPLMTQHLSWHEKYNDLVSALQPFTATE